MLVDRYTAELPDADALLAAYQERLQAVDPTVGPAAALNLADAAAVLAAAPEHPPAETIIAEAASNVYIVPPPRTA